ncbi:hypothetical protein [Arthrobacter sp. UYEF20]|uniref:hypothetical protein n=1 Tax=Arthrobacter sp. UYEF20 TaxID=1756363 RepID=UPI0033938B11
MMNIQPQETGPEVPEDDALEQRTPVLPENTEELPDAGRRPDDVPEADFLEQRTAVQPVSAGYDGIDAGAGADLIEQATGSFADGEDDYPDAREESDY